LIFQLIYKTGGNGGNSVFTYGATTITAGGGGSGGTSASVPGVAGTYGGGGGGNAGRQGSAGGDGGVRIIWSITGFTRSFPAANTRDF